MNTIANWMSENINDDLREECGRKSAFLRSVIANLVDPSIERITYCQPNVSMYTTVRPVQLVMTDDTPSLDPDVKLQIEQAWEDWTSTEPTEAEADHCHIPRGELIPDWVDTVDYTRQPLRMSGRLQGGIVGYLVPTDLTTDQLMAEDGEVFTKEDGSHWRIVSCGAVSDFKTVSDELIHAKERTEARLTDIATEYFSLHLSPASVCSLQQVVRQIKKTHAIDELSPKPLTPRDRLRALKAHPRSAKGRR